MNRKIKKAAGWVMVCGGSYLFLAIASGSWIAPLIAMTILGAIVLGFFWIIEN